MVISTVPFRFILSLVLFGSDPNYRSDPSRTELIPLNRSLLGQNRTNVRLLVESTGSLLPFCSVQKLSLNLSRIAINSGRVRTIVRIRLELS